MKTQRQFWTGTIASLGLIVLILDAHTALSGAREGIELCIYTVIPSLFPFFVLSILVNSAITGKSIKLLRPIGRACGIPQGAESVLLLGFLGGYPVGAQSISEAYTNRTLSKEDARRMLGFCSNAGPAFIFGMVSSLFSDVSKLWILWMIHIVTALFVGCVLPGKSNQCCKLAQKSPVTFPKAVEKSIKTMALVCGWVIIFRVLLAICLRWFLWLLPQKAMVGIVGIVELSNGCIELHTVILPGARFVLSAGMLGFGGICVAMQTVSVTRELGSGMYFPGKILQCTVSVFLAVISQQFLFSDTDRWVLPDFTLIIILSLISLELYFLCRKKTVAIPCKMVYNNNMITQR